MGSVKLRETYLDGAWGCMGSNRSHRLTCSFKYSNLRVRPGKEPEICFYSTAIFLKSPLPDPCLVRPFIMDDGPPPLEYPMPDTMSESTSLPAQSSNEETNVPGAWPVPSNNEGAGFWGEHTEATWGRTTDWGVNMNVGLRQDFAIQQSDHLDHLPTESWARIQRECCLPIFTKYKKTQTLNPRLLVQWACSPRRSKSSDV